VAPSFPLIRESMGQDASSGNGHSVLRPKKLLDSYLHSEEGIRGLSRVLQMGKRAPPRGRGEGLFCPITGTPFPPPTSLVKKTLSVINRGGASSSFSSNPQPFFAAGGWTSVLGGRLEMPCPWLCWRTRQKKQKAAAVVDEEESPNYPVIERG